MYKHSAKAVKLKSMKNFFRLTIFCFCTLIVFSNLLACKKPIMDTIKTADNKNGISYLALGDSYTIGERVAVNDRFPMQTTALLKNNDLQFQTPQIIATTGWTTTDLLNAIQEEKLSKGYDVVTLLIGVNNQYQRKSIDDYRDEFTALLNLSIQFARNNKNHVIVLSIPDYSVMPFSANLNKQLIARDIDAFNAVNKEVTESLGVTYLDITAISREAATNMDLVADDGLHPSGEQYGRWAALLAPLIKAKL